jgi:hypothetical protein
MDNTLSANELQALREKALELFGHPSASRTVGMNRSNWKLPSRLPDATDPKAGAELPIAWRLHWLPISDRAFDEKFRPEPLHKDFPSREEAEAEKKLLIACLVGMIVACVMPRFVSKEKRQRKLTAGQDNLALTGWPVQIRPQRLVAPRKKGRHV